jgi:predicted nuclease with TOPRIM domain
MSRHNALGVIERVLDLQDSLTQANQDVSRQSDQIKSLRSRVEELEKEVKGFDEILQQSIKEKRLMEEELAKQGIAYTHFPILHP